MMQRIVAELSYTLKLENQKKKETRSWDRRIRGTEGFIDHNESNMKTSV